MQTATAVSHAQSNAPKPKYQVILRVVRPQWRIQPSAATINQMDYRAITGSTLTIADPASDKEFLEAVRKANPRFIITGLISKASITLPVDTEWLLPAKVSRQQLNLAIVKNKIDLLREKLPTTSHTDVSIKVSKVTTLQKDPHIRLLPPIKGNYSQSVIDRTYNHGYVLLSYYLRSFVQQKDNQNSPYITADVVLSMPLRSTKCLQTNLPVLENGPAPKLLPTDVLFATVTERR